MEPMKVVKTIYPENYAENFNEWTQWFLDMFKKEKCKSKRLKGDEIWEQNIYRPKK